MTIHCHGFCSRSSYISVSSFFFNPKAKQNEVFFSGQENQVGVPFHIFDVVFLGLIFYNCFVLRLWPSC